MAGVPGAPFGEFARRLQPFHAVGRDRFEQPVARPVAALVHDDQRLIHQPGQRGQHLAGIPGVAEQRTHRGQRAVLGVDRYPAQHVPLGFGEQLPAPVDGRAQRAVPVGRVAEAAGEHLEPPVELRQQLPHAEHAHLRRREFQRQGQSVEFAADRGDVAAVGVVEAQAGHAGGEQLRGAGLDQPFGAGGFGVGQRQRRHRDDRLAAHGQRRATRRQDAALRAFGEHRLHQSGGGVDDVLAVVQHQQRPPTAQEGHDPIDRAHPPRRLGTRAVSGRGRVHVHAQHPQDRVGERVGAVRTVQPVELDEPHAVGETVDESARDRQRHPGLADAAGADQGDEPVGQDLRGDLLDHRIAPDQRIRRFGQVVPGREHLALGRIGQQGRVLVEDGAVQFHDLAAGVGAPGLGEQRAQFGETVECVGGATGPVERAHLDGPQVLPERMLAHQLVDLGHERAMFAQFEPQFGEFAARGDPGLLQRARRLPGEREVEEVGEGGSAPHREGVAQHVHPQPGVARALGPLHEGEEPRGIQAVRLGAEEVAGRRGDDAVPAAGLGVLERAAELGHLGVQGSDRVGGRDGGPHVVYQAIDR